MSTAGSQPETSAAPGAIGTYFDIALYLLVLTGFATLAFTGGLDIPTTFLVSAAILFRGYLLLKRRTLLLPERWTTILTLSYVVFYLADYLLISGRFVNATVHLVLFVMGVRLFSARRERDQYFLAIIAFLMVLSAAVMTVNSLFLVGFAAFMLMAVATFILMEMRRSAAAAAIRCKDGGDPRLDQRLGWSLAGISSSLMLLILLGAAGIFFLLPRVSSGYLSAYARGNEVSTGFSDTVQLGRIGEIQQSSSIVMHIQIDGDDHGDYDLKWRGIALSVFDGKSWSNPHEQYRVPRLPDGGFALTAARPRRGPLDVPSKAMRAVHYRVLMEPDGASVFFLAAKAQTLAGNYQLVTMDEGGAVFDLDAQHPVGRYEATSNIAGPTDAELRTASNEYAPEVLLNYLQLPPLDARIPQLAQQITRTATNSYDKAAAVEGYLRNNFGYTLQLPRALPRDPLANFLFERRQGHCEYFASSMAVMLRSLQIPARVVNGFRTGEFNDVTSQYVIRASDAHAWVEAYFAGYGWVSFDPTPASVLPTRTGWGRVLLYMDAMGSFWREWVVNYDVAHQLSLGEAATRSSTEGYHEVRHWMRRHYHAWRNQAARIQDALTDSPARWNLTALAGMAVILLFANAGRLWRALRTARLAARPRKDPQMAATIWYERMTRVAAKRGWKKLPEQTPGEFVICIDDAAVRRGVAQFTQHYESARFGGSAEDAERLPQLYEEVSTAARR